MVDQTIPTALAIGVPSLAVLVGIRINNSCLSDLRNAIDKRFDDLKSVNEADLRRVEEVLDARLRHIEEKLKII